MDQADLRFFLLAVGGFLHGFGDGDVVADGDRNQQIHSHGEAAGFLELVDLEKRFESDTVDSRNS